MLTQRLHNSPLTHWIFRYWQHKETGRICILPFWKNPGEHWHVCNYRE